MPKKPLVTSKSVPNKSQEDDDDSSWEDTDKLLLKKQQRKQEQLKKRELQLAKKAETKLLLEKEVNSLRSTKPQFQKVTRAQIGANFKREKVDKSVKVLVENLNRVKIEGVARSVDEAIEVFQEKNVDRHPEKRRKVAFAAFETRRIKELRAERPELRLSQMMEIVFKEWQKSPENPLNFL